jgi:hypothetical protein
MRRKSAASQSPVKANTTVATEAPDSVERDNVPTKNVMLPAETRGPTIVPV